MFAKSSAALLNSLAPQTQRELQRGVLPLRLDNGTDREESFGSPRAVQVWLIHVINVSCWPQCAGLDGPVEGRSSMPIHAAAPRSLPAGNAVPQPGASAMHNAGGASPSYPPMTGQANPPAGYYDKPYGAGYGAPQPSWSPTPAPAGGGGGSSGSYPPTQQPNVHAHAHLCEDPGRRDGLRDA